MAKPPIRTISEAGSVGIVRTQYFHFAEPPNEMPLESGQKLGPITLAYETYGQLNKRRDNAILILHALSGDAHVAGKHSPTDKKSGWWDMMVGPGKAFDTEKYFVICSNIIGGCKGSTGPSSINPRTGKPYALSFPAITVKDMVRAQKHLIDHLGIEKIFSMAGGSLGGMQVLQWAIDYPDRVRSAICIAATSRLSAQAIAFNEVGRQAIMSDPNWNGGNYYGKAIPATGLALARMIGHITYRSEESLREKFDRRLQDKEKFSFDFSREFQVESYLHYKGESFVKRFDANSYLYITRAMDYFDLTAEFGSLKKAFANVKSKFAVISFSSDWLFPTSESKEIVRALRSNNMNVTFCEIRSPHGHDAFLLEEKELTYLIKNFLSNIST